MDKVILFGAGAEQGYNLALGSKFSESVVGINTEEMDDAIKEFYGNIEDEWYPVYRETKWKDEDLLKASVKKKWLTEENIPETKDEFDDKIAKEIAELADEDRKNILNQYPSYMGILDERFHTLISPRSLGPYKFWSVIGCYWRAYLTLVRGMFPDEKYSTFMNDPKKTYERMCEHALNSMNDNNDTYYKILNKYNALGSTNIKILTTNYTPLCSKISGISDENIAYLHGSFKWFERARETEILDVTDDNPDFSRKDYFPFVFLQSGIKPIVSSVQINEWTKALSFLNDESELYIVGYRANCDDNHINSMIRDYIVEGHKVVYFDFDKVKEEDVLKRFFIEKKSGNFELIHIDSDTALKKFEEEIFMK